jgi:hypothetical protein
LDGKTRFNVPAGLLPGEITFTFTPQPWPNHDWSGLFFANNSFRLEAEDSLGNPVTVFDAPISVSIAYSDDDVADIPESLLGLYSFDETAMAWNDAVNTCSGGEYTRIPDENIFSLPVCHLSEFAVFAGFQHQIFLPLAQR